MATYDAASLQRVPGRIAYGCTDLTAAWPHGGTGLGLVKGVNLRRGAASYPVPIEGYGGEIVEMLEAGEVWALGCWLRSWEDDALSLIFPNTSVGTTSQHRKIVAPGSVKAGTWMSGRAVVLVFTPEGSTHAQSATVADSDAPFAVLHRAIPLIEDQAQIKMGRTEDFGMPVLFQGIRHATNGIKTIAQRRDITAL